MIIVIYPESSFLHQMSFQIIYSAILPETGYPICKMRFLDMTIILLKKYHKFKLSHFGLHRIIQIIETMNRKKSL